MAWTDFLVQHHVIQFREMEIYSYGMELLLSTVLNFGFMILNSVFVLQMPLTFIPYTAVYIPFRLSAGGYHAKNHLSCILYTQSTYVLCVLFMKFMATHAVQFTLPIMGVSLLIIWFLSPVESKNKPLSQKESKKAKQRSRKLASLFGLFAVIFTYLDMLHLEFILTMIAAIVSVTLSLVIEYIKINS